MEEGGEEGGEIKFAISFKSRKVLKRATFVA
jgi:hypothetical protein